MWGRCPWPAFNAIVKPGSSPRVWGRWYLVLLPPQDLAVHPHACGADAVGLHAGAVVGRFIPTRVGQMSRREYKTTRRRGSSPRVWGRCDVALRRQLAAYRFIPTRVGQIFCHMQKRRFWCGSSPRVWGRCAARFSSCTKSSVHPHACGADIRIVAAMPDDLRFIPTRVGQMRLRLGRDLNTLRFIPTRVGQMPGHSTSFGMTSGSSPRVWGRWQPRLTATGAFRFIPTRVGQMAQSSTARLTAIRFIPTRVGQMMEATAQSLARAGSSPRVWGRFFVTKSVAPKPAVHPHACGADTSSNAAMIGF